MNSGRTTTQRIKIDLLMSTLRDDGPVPCSPRITLDEKNVHEI